MYHVNEINSFTLQGTECLNVTQFCVGNSFIYYCAEGFLSSGSLSCL